MSETKFSPGPWKAIRDPLHYGSLSTVYAGSTDEKAGIGAQMLVQIGGWSDPTEQEANANLIAAAPDMYKTLEWLLHIHSIPGIARGEVQKTLAKARGEA